MRAQGHQGDTFRKVVLNQVILCTPNAKVIRGGWHSVCDRPYLDLARYHRASLHNHFHAIQTSDTSFKQLGEVTLNDIWWCCMKVSRLFFELCGTGSVEVHFG